MIGPLILESIVSVVTAGRVFLRVVVGVCFGFLQGSTASLGASSAWRGNEGTRIV